jgi:hypothetical protein
VEEKIKDLERKNEQINWKKILKKNNLMMFLPFTRHRTVARHLFLNKKKLKKKKKKNFNGIFTVHTYQSVTCEQ